MALPEVVISGVGITSPIGHNEITFIESLIQGRSGISLYEGEPSVGLGPTPLGRVVAFDEQPAEFSRAMDRVSRLSMSAADQAMRSAGLSMDGLDDRMGVSNGRY